MTARQSVAATRIGEGVARACYSSELSRRLGSVVGTFSHGFYVCADESIFAVGGPDIFAGPIHLVVETLPPEPAEGSPVYIEATRLITTACTIELSLAARWRPDVPSTEQFRRIAPVFAGLDRDEAIPDDVAHVWERVRDAVCHSDLHEARKLLQGLGRGLTPTGDDVLAGILLIRAWADPTCPLPREVAVQSVTTDLSRCFLSWAALGQSIEPIHRLVTAADSRQSSKPLNPRELRPRFDRAAATVASIGGSSGQGVLGGLGLAAKAWLMQHQRATREV